MSVKGCSIKTNVFQILVLDDDPAILELFRRMLQTGEGGEPAPTGVCFDLTCCARAEEAVEVFRGAVAEGRRFSVAFLDILMPGGRDGVWAAEEIRKLDQGVGIVMVTGDVHANLDEVEHRVPPPDKLFYLEKPFTAKEIRQFSLALCARWEAEKEVDRVYAHLETMVEEKTAALSAANEHLNAEMKNRLETETFLRNSRKDFRRMIIQNADGIIIFDPEQVVRFVNPAAEGLFQRKAEELVGTSPGYPLVDGERTELDIVQTKGDPMVVEMRVTETRWEGEKAYLASLRDISEHSRTKDELRQSLEVLEKTMTHTVEAMARTIEIRDPYTAGHQYRVALLSQAIGREIGLPEPQILGLYMAALVHDIGKICIPAQILSKPGYLTKPEMELIQCHPGDGYDILKDVDFPWPIARIVMQHQERMDGSGYPKGLSGEEIVMEARILAVADVVEAMASDRPYRAALGLTLALEEISKNSGKFYDRRVVDACVTLFKDKQFILPTAQPHTSEKV
jgi:HD-GYP domain-containing protein (c-di-GMP phosphodiesterase class II)